MTKLLFSFRNLVSKTGQISGCHSVGPTYSRLVKCISVNRILQCQPRSISTTSAVFKDGKDKNPDDEYREYPRTPKPEDDPIGRTWRILKHDVRSLYDRNQPPLRPFSSHVDILIIGGGIMGSCLAHTFLERIPPKSLAIMVVEKDPTYSKSATVMSIGGLRQQFSLRENVEMARYGVEYFRKLPQLLDIDDDPAPDIKYHPYGYLQLATEEQAETMQETWLQQKELGCHVELLTKERLKDRFPWINTNGIEVGLYGTEGEGWFDAWALHFGLKKKAWYLGAEYINAEVVGFEFEDMHHHVAGTDWGDRVDTVRRAVVKLPDGELRPVTFSHCIVAAGHESSKIAEMARIGRKPGLLSVPLPIEPRRRYVYCINAPNGPGIDCPLVINPDGTYFRREGYAGGFVVGHSPPLGEEPESGKLEVDYEHFDNRVYPAIAHRVPGFRDIKLNSAWAGYYDYNTFDQTLVCGPHPYHQHMYFACGLSGYGIQMAPAVARGTMEMIIDGKFRTIDLTKLHFERFYVGKRIEEKHVN